MATLKDSVYHLLRIKNSIRAQIPKAIFRQYDPVTELITGAAKRAAEISADVTQAANDFYIDSAKGDRLTRRLTNEGIPPVAEHPADDGTITVSKQTEPSGPTSFPIGSVTVKLPPDPSNPSAVVVTYANTAIFTIDVGARSWTVPFAAASGGAITNLPIGTELQMTSQVTILDSAVVATAFTTGRDAENAVTDDPYRARGKLEINSRSRGTDDAILAAALRAGASFVFSVEDTTNNPPITLYAGAADGTLSDGLKAAIHQQLDGDPNASPPIKASRCQGIAVNVQPAVVTNFNVSIGLVLKPYVVGALLTALRTDITAAITAYFLSLNSQDGITDRTMRVNAIKAIIRTFKTRGVVDVVNSTFLPATDTALGDNVMSFIGTISWL